MRKGYNETHLRYVNSANKDKPTYFLLRQKKRES